jgi:hypothetical protein
MTVAIGKGRRSGAQLGRSWKETSARGFQERPVAFLAGFQQSHFWLVFSRKVQTRATLLSISRPALRSRLATS